jgi:hypothetical protein
MEPLVLKDLPMYHGANSTTFRHPSFDNDATVPGFFVHHAANSPEHPLIVFDEADGSIRTIGYKEIFGAICRAAADVKREYLRGARVPEKRQSSGELPVIAILAITGTFPNYVTETNQAQLFAQFRHSNDVPVYRRRHARGTDPLSHFRP